MRGGFVIKNVWIDAWDDQASGERLLKKTYEQKGAEATHIQSSALLDHFDGALSKVIIYRSS